MDNISSTCFSSSRFFEQPQSEAHKAKPALHPTHMGQPGSFGRNVYLCRLRQQSAKRHVQRESYSGECVDRDPGPGLLQQADRPLGHLRSSSHIHLAQSLTASNATDVCRYSGKNLTLSS